MKKLACALFVACIFTSLAYPKRIHIFGESHALRFFANEHLKGTYVYNYKNLISIPVEIHWLGPKTMHSIGRDGLGVINAKAPKEIDIINGNVTTKNGIPAQEGDIIAFTLGEIDVRNHIGKQRDEKKRELDEILDTLVYTYFRTINANRALYQNVTCVIVEIIPPIDQKYTNNSQPFYGTLEDRIHINRELNRRLKDACAIHDCIFLPIRDLYGLPDGSLNPDLSDHVIHIAFKYNYLVRERLIEMLMAQDVLP